MPPSKTPWTQIIAYGLILSLTVFVLTTVILNKKSNDRLQAALEQTQKR